MTDYNRSSEAQQTFKRKGRPKNPIKFKLTLNQEQKEAKKQILYNTVTVLKGKAGSGKSLLAAQVALDLLFTKEIEKKLSKNLSDLTEIFSSLDDVTHSQPIYLSNIPFVSLCEHHLLPFFGSFDIAVFPKNKIAGISKFSDLIYYLSNDLTLQEKIRKW